MTEKTFKNYRKGAIRAFMEESERTAFELKSVSLNFIQNRKFN